MRETSELPPQNEKKIPAASTAWGGSVQDRFCQDLFDSCAELEWLGLGRHIASPSGLCSCRGECKTQVVVNFAPWSLCVWLQSTGPSPVEWPVLCIWRVVSNYQGLAFTFQGWAGPGIALCQGNDDLQTSPLP